MGAREFLDNDNDLLSDMDAQTWAKRFVSRVRGNPSIATDEGTMLAWFAGAIMVGYDRGVEAGKTMARAEQPVQIRPYSPSEPYAPYARPNQCSSCGLVLEGVMGYVCANARCPVGLGGVQC